MSLSLASIVGVHFRHHMAVKGTRNHTALLDLARNDTAYLTGFLASLGGTRDVGDGKRGHNDPAAVYPC